MMKALLNKSVSLLALIGLFPLFCLIGLLIRLDDGGPIFFGQYRLGQYKRPFLIIKFRTMHEGQVTRIGQLLRRTGLDELPQLLNILRGEMQLVGPRPLTYADITRLGWDRRHYISRWHVRPGITGLAQLYAGHSAHYSWLCDRIYLARHSLRLDLKIILSSILMLLLGKQRVRQWIHQRKAELVNWQPAPMASAGQATSLVASTAKQMKPS